MDEISITIFTLICLFFVSHSLLFGAQSCLSVTKDGLGDRMDSSGREFVLYELEGEHGGDDDGGIEAEEIMALVAQLCWG